MIIKLVRHGQSMFNSGDIDPTTVGEKDISLTELGHSQAVECGSEIGRPFLKGDPEGREAMIFSGPFNRHLETTEGILVGAGCPDLRVIEDATLRELDHGYSSVEEVERQVLGPREVHGRFFYRFTFGGQSPADKYAEMGTFLDTLYARGQRKWRNRALIVTSSITLRAFVLRFFHLSCKVYDLLEKPKNCQVVTIARKSEVDGSPYLKDLRGVAPTYESSEWGCWGLGVRDEPHPAPDPEYNFDFAKKAPETP